MSPCTATIDSPPPPRPVPALDGRNGANRTSRGSCTWECACMYVRVCVRDRACHRHRDWPVESSHQGCCRGCSVRCEMEAKHNLIKTF
eukprot:scaffold204150_cov34-Tisochrysis_lutea.AAC.5